MRPWQAILLIIVLAFLAISSGWDVLYRLTYVLVILFILSWLWARYSLRKLVFRRTAASGRVQVGETFDERLMLDNLGVIPKLWVQIADGSTLPGHRAGYVATMGGRKRVSWRARTVCRQRGRFQLGPVTATSGDALSRIHWRSSAHYNKLMVKEFDLDPAVDAWIFLDLHDAVQAGEGEHSTEEYGVTIAATIATYLLRQDLSLGLIVNAERREFLSLDRGDRQMERVLELLAVVRSGPGPELREALALDALHFGRNSVAIVITPSTSRDWHDGVQHLQRRGVQAAVIGLNAASFEDKPADEDTLALLEGAGIPVMRIKRGDPLSEVLER